MNQNNGQKFKIVSDYQPAGDQPKAIKQLTAGLKQGMDKQTLLGVTGSGKTFTMAQVIEQTQMPTLVIAHNKTLAAQLCNEFRGFFPNNAVEYFVSFYDYYQPEAYMPHSDTYIEKESQINDEIDRLRHACTQAILSRKDVIIVASVSCIYSLGSPKEYEQVVLHIKKHQPLDRRAVMEQLIELHFERTNADLKRGQFRMHGQVFEVMPVNEEVIWRLEISEKIERIEKIHAVTRKVLFESDDIWLFPAKHYVAGPEARSKAIVSIRQEMDERLNYFKKNNKVLEYERLKRRIAYDIEMIEQIGYCNGIENYSRHFDGREAGEPAFTLLDYFHYATEKTKNKEQGTKSKTDNGRRRIGYEERQSGFLTIIDESHVTIPQIRGMYFGDKARKDTLIEHGFRLPSASDNRPLTYGEFEARIPQVVYVSATPAEYELKESKQIAEQIVRPTGLIDPEVIICPITGSDKATKLQSDKATKLRNNETAKQNISVNPDYPSSVTSQVEDVIVRIQERIKKGERALVTTLTKKMAEDLSEHLQEKGLKVKYLHSDVQTLDRIDILMKLRTGEIEVIVGVNLLREGLDLPEVSLVAILDADKEGFLRSDTALIQTIGRAARNVNGLVVLYADHMTGSIERALAETQRRRVIQLAYNQKHGITPKTIQKEIRNLLEEFGIDPLKKKKEKRNKKQNRKNEELGTKNGERITDLDLLGDERPLAEIVKEKELQMREAAQELEFELAAVLRDEIRELKARLIVSLKKEKKIV